MFSFFLVKHYYSFKLNTKEVTASTMKGMRGSLVWAPHNWHSFPGAIWIGLLVSICDIRKHKVFQLWTLCRFFPSRIYMQKVCSIAFQWNLDRNQAQMEHKLLMNRSCKSVDKSGSILFTVAVIHMDAF